MPIKVTAPDGSTGGLLGSLGLWRALAFAGLAGVAILVARPQLLAPPINRRFRPINIPKPCLPPTTCPLLPATPGLSKLNQAKSIVMA